MDLNNRRTGKDATKRRALGLLGHSVNVNVRVGCVNKNFNLGNNFLTIGDRAFILHMCIACDN